MLSGVRLVSDEFRVFARGSEELILFPSVPLWVILPAGGGRFLRDFGAEEKIQCDQSFLEALTEAGVVVKKGGQGKTGPAEKLAKGGVIISVWLSLVEACNLACRQCFLGDTPDGNESLIRVGEIEKFVASVGKYAGREKINIALTGGEPLLRKDITGIAEVCKTEKTYPKIISNGLLLTEDLCSFFAKKRVPVCISLDGATSESNDFLRGKGTYSRVLEKIKLAVSCGVEVTLTMTVHAGNQWEVVDFVKLAERLEVSSVNFSPLTLLGRASGSSLSRPNYYAYVLALCEYAASSEKARSLLRKGSLGLMLDVARTPIRCEACGTGSSTVSVTSNGNVYPCPSFQIPEYYLGNLRRRNFEEIWENNEKLVGLRSFSTADCNEFCSDCEARFFCGGGCRGDASRGNGGDILSRCANCEEMKKLYVDLIWMLYDHDVLDDVRVRDFDFAGETYAFQTSH